MTPLAIALLTLGLWLTGDLVFLPPVADALDLVVLNFLLAGVMDTRGFFTFLFPPPLFTSPI